MLSNYMVFVCVCRFRSDPKLVAHIQDMEEKVLNGRCAPGTASDILVDTFLKSNSS